MKKYLALLLAICLILSGCSLQAPNRDENKPEPNYFSPAKQNQASVYPQAQPEILPTEQQPEPDPEPEPEPETEPEPYYFNPLNGEELDAPFDRRIYAVSINNLRDALPHYGVNGADLYFETFVNGSVIRGLALYTNPEGYDAIGPVRSNRLMFNDICLHYDSIMVHAGGSDQVLWDCTNRAVDNFNADAWYVMEMASFRDYDRYNSGYSWEHCLFAIGSGLPLYAESKQMRTTMEPGADYNLRFADDGIPSSGTPARDITVTITVNQYKKDTTMVYDPSLDKYVYNEYGLSLTDGATGEPEAFRNVLILMGEITYDGPYQRLNMLNGGEGWYANGGMAIPIRWGAADETSPLWVRTMDGEPLILGKGNTYIAITQTGSQVTGIGA